MSLKKIYSVFFASYPLLCLYTAFGSFTIGDIMLFGLLCLYMIYERKIRITHPILIIFVIYIIGVLCIRTVAPNNIDVSSQSHAAIIRGIKLLFYSFCVITIGSSWLDFKVFCKTSIVIGLVSSLFMFYQYFMFLGTGKVVLGQIPGLTIALQEYTELDYDTMFSFTFRPSSLFLEPAMFAQYMMVPLSIVLLANDYLNIKGKFLIAILFTVSIILSTSGQGILYLVLVYLYSIFVHSKNKIKILLYTCIFILAFVVAYVTIEPMQYAIDRLIFGEDAQNARLGSYKYCFDLIGSYMIFGNGYGIIPYNQYLAGAAYVWYGGGVIGLLIALMVFFDFYIKGQISFSKCICLLFFVMFWGTALFYNYMLFWFFSIACGVTINNRKING